jgi:DNA-directed RNA polymerase subunit F
MELKLTTEEAQKILLEWAKAKFGDVFNSVRKEGYSYTESFVFTKVESDDEAL